MARYTCAMPKLTCFPVTASAGLCCALLITGSTLAAPTKLSDQRQHFRNAINAIEHGSADAWKPYVVDLSDYPLLPYIDLALLERNRGNPSLTQVEAFTKRWPDTLVSRDLRESALRRYATDQRLVFVSRALARQPVRRPALRLAARAHCRRRKTRLRP